MRYIMALFFACCFFSSEGQSLATLENQLYSKLNAHHGMGLFASKRNGEPVFIYNSYAWFSMTLNEKTLEIAYTQVTLENGKKEEKSYKHKIRYADIKSFEYRDCTDIGRPGDDEEVAQSPRLYINYTIEGKPDNVRVGFHLKGDTKVVEELNKILKEIQKRI
ncbi:MAG: hypothetical protein WDO16_10505 [Bacteroidota bacterium]